MKTQGASPLGRLRALSRTASKLMRFSAAFTERSFARMKSRRYAATMDRDGIELRRRLAVDPLARAQNTSARRLTESLEAQMARVVAKHAKKGSTKQTLSGSLRDITTAVSAGWPEIAAGLSDVPAQMRLLQSVVASAKHRRRPLTLAEIVDLAATQTQNLGPGFELAASTMQNVARAPDLYLAFARDHRIPLARIGLDMPDLRSSQSLAIGFMSRFVQDPIGKGYALFEDRKPGGDFESLPGFRTQSALTAIGGPYHSLDVMRVALFNKLLPPKAVKAALEFYYTPAHRKMGNRDPQGTDKATLDFAAVEVAQRLLERKLLDPGARVSSFLATSAIKGASSLVGLAAKLGMSRKHAPRQRLGHFLQGDLSAKGELSDTAYHDLARASALPWLR
jgi:hypothetical protein